MNWQDLANTLNATLAGTLGHELHIVSAHAVGGGDIHQAYQLHCADKNYFLKLNRAEALPLFASETHNLQAIAASNSILCPKPYGYGEHNGQAWLLMAFLPLTSHGDDLQRGRDLALMHHQINRNPPQQTQPFGWFEDNYIGHTLQKNRWHSDWVSFYREERLRPQLELAQLRGAPSGLFELGQRLLDALPFWFERYRPEASLLHGDLWGGNSAFTADGDAVVFDPACYYGDRETDIAMTELFGGFSPDFYAGYNQVFPLDGGYASRKPLYNLYHILNHFNLFGGHYAQQAQQTLHSLLKQANA